MQKDRNGGFTLSEVLVTLSITAILTTTIIPSVAGFYANIEARNQVMQIRQIISYTRVQAITNMTHTTLCPLNADQSCGHNWNQTLTVFQDENNNLRRDSDELVLNTLPATRSDQELRTFNNHAVSFNARGYSGYHSGSFGYCYSRQQKIGMALIISRMGKIRNGTDSNQDGLQETANGNNVPCPS